MKNNYDFPVELRPIYLGEKTEIPGKKAVVRTDTMTPLGIVSDSYGLVKHANVIDSLRKAGKEYDIEEKVELINNGAKMFYEMTFPKVQMEIKKGDILKMRMIVKNSYNGSNALQVIFGAYRLVCSNGMILGTTFMSFMYRHIGSMGGIRDASFFSQYQDVYKEYIKLFGERMPLITAMARKELPANIDPLFNDKAINMPQYLVAEAKASYEAEKDKSVWGYYNALTFAISHKMKEQNPRLSLKFGIEAWATAEKVMN